MSSSFRGKQDMVLPMKPKVASIRTRIAWVLTLAFCCMIFSMCRPAFTRCETDANCPIGQQCTQGNCTVSTQEANATNDAGHAWEGIHWFALDGKRPDIPTDTQACERASDCPQSAPHCHQSVCVAGHVSFDFKKGHVVIDPDAPLSKCQEGDQCQAWQQCHLGFCRDNVGTSSKATGKWLDEALFLSDYSFSSLHTNQQKKFLHVTMVGVFSDRVQYHLVLRLQTDRIALGKNSIDRNERSAILYKVQLDLSPPRRIPLAYANTGSIFVSHAKDTLGGKVAGSADLLLAAFRR
jgi:hypothetical protein